jgi:predicted site-specific integrase-resolvase
MTDRLLDVSVVARKIGVSAETVRAWIRADRIEYEQTPTGRYRIRASVITSIMQRKTQNTQNRSV